MLFKGIIEDITYYVCINMYGVSLNSNITNEQRNLKHKMRKVAFLTDSSTGLSYAIL